MNLPDHLQAKFDLGYCYLTFAGQQVFLARPDAIFESTNGPQPLLLVLVDLPKLFQRFDELVPDQKTFCLNDLGRAADVSGATVKQWSRLGVLSPSVKPPGGKGVVPSPCSSRCRAE
jgi:hypothetical protein